MTTITRSILAFGLSLSLATVACSSDSGNDDDKSTAGKGGNAGKGGTSGGAGKGGTAGNDGPDDSGPGAQEPDGDSADAWKEFLESGQYRKEGWVAETPAPRAKKSISPHGRVRVFFNEKLKEAQGKSPAEYAKGSVVVKEFFDADDKSVGWTAFRKVTDNEADDPTDWQVYCVGPRTVGATSAQTIDRCVQGKDVTVDSPVIGTIEEHKHACNDCHHKGTNATTTKLLHTRAPR